MAGNFAWILYFVKNRKKDPKLIFIALIFVTALGWSCPLSSLSACACALSLFFTGGDFVTAESSTKITKISIQRKLPATRY